ncbi:sigma factor-like helix-turn-helix DNA-binding protein [Lentzea sp. JNUCC 0626]|uniref:sigma factor-like helix-turn-helix DNA-binding protein n=1 Tax=Lentzea sp. JNUCC 0626 TaxID=3367513 RepID=UPI00374A3553
MSVRGPVADALSALELDDRVVVVRACCRGQTVAEVAAALGVPREIVKARLSSGLRALREALQQNGVIES